MSAKKYGPHCKPLSGYAEAEVLAEAQKRCPSLDWKVSEPADDDGDLMLLLVASRAIVNPEPELWQLQIGLHVGGWRWSTYVFEEGHQSWVGPIKHVLAWAVPGRVSG